MRDIDLAIDLSIQLNREKRESEQRALAAIVEARYGRLPPMPIRQPAETDEMFMARLKEWRNGPREQVCVNKSAGAGAKR
jgi:hypothetical protein